MRIDQLPHQSIKEKVRTGAPVFILVNPVEYHGPHLSLHTDGLISEGIAKDLYSRMLARHPSWPFLEFAPIELGVDPTPGPGSQKTSYFRLRSSILQAAKSLVEIGAEKVIWVTFHGGPAHNTAIHAGIDYLADKGIPSFNVMNLVLETMIDYDESYFAAAFESISDLAVRERLKNEMMSDLHGGFYETSMALHYAPQSVAKNYQETPDCPKIELNAVLSVFKTLVDRFGSRRLSREMGFGFYALSWAALKPFPGYTSRPRLANLDAGRVFAADLMRRSLTACERVFEQKEKAPRPILEWSALIGSLLFG